MIIIIIREIDPLNSGDNAISYIKTKRYHHVRSNNALKYGNNQSYPWQIFPI